MFKSIEALLKPRRVVHAHCDLPCGVYDPAQARIEAESVAKIQEKYQDTENQKKPSETTEEFKTRAIAIKEHRADLVKEHLWVLWTDYFKPNHLEKYPQLHELVHAQVRFVDVPGGMSAQGLAALREMDALCVVLRAFGPDADPARELEEIRAELILADLAVVESALEGARKRAKGGRSPVPEL